MTKPKVYTRTEYGEHSALVAMVARLDDRYPDLKLLFHVPNDARRSPSVAGRMKAMGLKSGVPDLLLPVRRGIYSGLACELKVAPNKPTDTQLWWLGKLADQGWYAFVSFNADDAYGHILRYIQLPSVTTG